MKKLLSALLLFIVSCGGHATVYFPAYITPATSYATVADLEAARLAIITAKQAAWAATPLPDTSPSDPNSQNMTGVVRHYCDCGTGSSVNCVAGNDSTGDGTDTNPYQTIGAATTWLSNSSSAGDTVALCKGGAFLTATTLSIGSSHCLTNSTCNDLREYASPVFTSSAKPIIQETNSAAQLFHSSHSYEKGVRFLNLHFKGVSGGAAAHRVAQIDTAGGNISFYNDDIDYFTQAIYIETGAGMIYNVNIEANNFSNNSDFGILATSGNSSYSWNYMVNNGSNTGLNHAIYNGSQIDAPNLTQQGNYITGYYHDGIATHCSGTAWVSHASATNWIIKDNVVDIASGDANGACYGMAFSNNTQNGNPVYYDSSTFSGNIIINGGQNPLMVSGCTYCFIENNVVINDYAGGGIVGIDIPNTYNRGADHTSTNNTIRNNTVIYTSSILTGHTDNIGIRVDKEGTGHVIANNVVYNAQTSGTFQCFSYGLALTAYTFIDNNDCYSASSANWEQSRSESLAAWQSTATAYGFDAHSTTSNPAFTNIATYDLHPTGAPLSGGGNNTNKSTLDILGNTRPNPPAIGAYEP